MRRLAGYALGVRFEKGTCNHEEYDREVIILQSCKGILYELRIELGTYKIRKLIRPISYNSRVIGKHMLSIHYDEEGRCKVENIRGQIIDNEGKVNRKYIKRFSARYREKKPIWVFMGNSNLGKTYVSSHISKPLSVFETDSVDTLPDMTDYDLIVLGNRSKFTLDDVLGHIDLELVDVIKVKFSQVEIW